MSFDLSKQLSKNISNISVLNYFWLYYQPQQCNRVMVSVLVVLFDLLIKKLPHLTLEKSVFPFVVFLESPFFDFIDLVFNFMAQK
jgi:hypothetical protein